MKHPRPARTPSPSSIDRSPDPATPLGGFSPDDAVDPALILLADRMCDVLEAEILPHLIPRGDGRMEMGFVHDLPSGYGHYVRGTWRHPHIVLSSPAILAGDDPVAAVALALAEGVGAAWQQSRHGRGDVDEQARVVAEVYRDLLRDGAPWRGTSLPDVT